MIVALWLLAVQGVIGAFDTLYYHEWRARLQALGYTVCRNKPYAGGFITEHYGRPARGLHALQIEINRGLYMDERELKPHHGFEQLSADLARLAEALLGYAEAVEVREAAE